MIALFIDVAGSTAETTRLGDEIGIMVVRRTLDTMIEALKDCLDAEGESRWKHFRRYGTAGDGVLFISFEEIPGSVVSLPLAVQLVRCAHRVQREVQTELKVKITIGTGPLEWDPPDQEMKPGSIPSGLLLSLVAARLQAECPPGGVAINAGLRSDLDPYPHIRSHFARRTRPMKGFGPTNFWVTFDQQAETSVEDSPRRPEFLIRKTPKGWHARLRGPWALIAAIVAALAAGHFLPSLLPRLWP